MDIELKAYLDDMRTGMVREIGEHLEVVETRIKAELGARIDHVEDKLGKRIDAVEDQLGKRIDAVEDQLGKRIDAVEDQLGKRIETLRLDVKSLERRVDSPDNRFTSPS